MLWTCPEAIGGGPEKGDRRALTGTQSGRVNAEFVYRSSTINLSKVEALERLDEG
jgi:hypothetical protein